jgi:hypothetical protein
MLTFLEHFLHQSIYLTRLDMTPGAELGVEQPAVDSHFKCPAC